MENAEKPLGVEVGVIWGSSRTQNTREIGSLLNEEIKPFLKVFAARYCYHTAFHSILPTKDWSTLPRISQLCFINLARNVAMQPNADTKDAIDYVEDSASRKQAFVDDEMPLPLLLEGLSPDELNKIGKRATWKLDLIIMPAMTMSAFSDDLHIPDCR